jgi:enoyl-CoA hydratase/carnithine racemase
MEPIHTAGHMHTFEIFRLEVSSQKLGAIMMQDLPDEKQPLPFSRALLADYEARHFQYHFQDGVATITLNRPERKNPLTFDSYAELRDLFRMMSEAGDIKVIVVTGAGENFCSGGDVHEIIGPLTKLDMPGLLAFTRMTGNVVKAMRACPQPIIAAIDGVCAGAGALLALASDLRLGTARSKTAFLFTRVGLAGCDMGACALLPRVIGQGRAAELLFTGRSMNGEEAERWGFMNRLCAPEGLFAEAQALALELASGPTFAHAMTKKMLHQEWNMGIDEAIESEAQAQAICMATKDFHRAYEAFVGKQKPVFKGN